MKELESGKKPRKKVIPQITLLNPEKVEKTINYNRKHGVDKDKEKGKNKIILRSARSKY
jgi:hypothetical protein